MKFYLEAISTVGIQFSFSFSFDREFVLFPSYHVPNIEGKKLFQFLAYTKDRTHSSGENPTEAEPVIYQKFNGFHAFFSSKWKIGLNFLMLNVEHY